MCLDNDKISLIYNCAANSSLVAFFNSAFVSAFISAGFGALFGALCAAWIANNIKAKEKLSKEIRALNTSITLCGDLINTFITLKKNHIFPIVEDYKFSYKNFTLQISDGNDDLFELDAKLFSVVPPKVNIETLLIYVHERLDLDNKGLMLSFALERQIDLLKTAMTERNEILSKWMDTSQNSTIDFAKWYFAFPDNQGRTNALYQTVVNQLEKYCDDVIMFARLLAAELEAHGKILKTQNRSKEIKILRINIGMLSNLNYLPSYANYKQWL